MKISCIWLEKPGAQVRPSGSHQVKADRVKSGQVRSGQARSAQVRSGQVTSRNVVRSGQVRPRYQHRHSSQQNARAVPQHRRLGSQGLRDGINVCEADVYDADGVVLEVSYMLKIWAAPTDGCDNGVSASGSFFKKRESSMCLCNISSDAPHRSGQAKTGQVRIGQVWSIQVRSCQVHQDRRACPRNTRASAG